MKQISTLCILICVCIAGSGQTADFSWQSIDGLYCSPSTIQFTKITTGNPIGYVWTFGNNSGSNSENPTTTFATAGTYTVRLIVIYKKSTLTVTKTIVINPAVYARINMDRGALCTPGVVNFSANVSGNVSSYEWSFGDQSRVPGAANMSHSFTSFGEYQVSLKATASTGCYGQTSATVKIERPVISADVTPLSGCIPTSTTFTASVGLPPSSAVSRYTWNYGDGSAEASTTTARTTHVYNAVGSYIPTLRIITTDGCSNNYTFTKLAFGTPPTNHIAYPKKTIFCGSESPQFVAKAINANKYFWNFGEGDTTSVEDTVINHRFRTLGNKTITVTPLFNDCPGTPISFSVEVIGVIAGFDYANTCNNMKHFTFHNTSQGNQSSRAWDFEDGTPTLHTLNVEHSFADTGTFMARLIVIDSITGCSDVLRQNIYTAEPLLTNPDSSICRNSNTTFTIPRNYNNPLAQYNWNVVGTESGLVSTVPYTLNANIMGHFNDNYVVIDNGPQYCPDTIRLGNNILVRGPQLSFDAPAEICLSKPYTVVNHSTPYVPTDLINEWHWDYGLPRDWNDNFQPAPYTYPYYGSFWVKLTAKDIKGCIDSLIKPLEVYDIPFLRSIPDVDTLCAGQSATLIAFHNDPITWTPSNALPCSTCDTLVVRPSSSITYYVTATSRFNCSVTDSIQIKVYERFTAVASKNQYSICSNENVQLAVSPRDKIINWTPPEGLSSTTVYNPIAEPKHSTTYRVTLRDSAGCFSSSTDVNVNVRSLPAVNAGPDRVLPYNTAFSLAPAYSTNVRSYTWSPADLLNCNNCPTPSGTATKSQTYAITVTSDSGCVAIDKVNVFVECKGVNLLLPTAFTPNSDNVNDYYYPITRGIKKIVRFAIYSREGLLMFESRNVQPNERSYGWNGKFRGAPQPSSAYVYLLEAICDAGETLNTKGSFVLIR